MKSTEPDERDLELERELEESAIERVEAREARELAKADEDEDEDR